MLVLAPIGVLLGIPFAYCLSVIGSILSVIVSMNFGFASVLWIAAIVYVLGFVSLQRATRGIS